MNARPHPDPLPRGEGIAIASASFCGHASRKSGGMTFDVAADVTPFPEGEGWSEGGLGFHLYFQIA